VINGTLNSVPVYIAEFIVIMSQDASSEMVSFLFMVNGFYASSSLIDRVWCLVERILM
jgi:hypothetical protein